MMTNVWIWLVPGAVGGALVLALVYRQLYLVGDRPAREVLASLAPLGAMGVRDLFSDAAERHLRVSLGPHQFRRAQYHRMIEALEYVGRISYNARLLQQWARYEMDRARTVGDPELNCLSVELIVASVHCRVCALVLRGRLHWCRARAAFLPFIAPPEFASLLTFGQVDLLDFYSRMSRAAGKLCRFYGEAYRRRLAEIL